MAVVDLTVEGRDLLFAKPGTKPAFPDALRIGGDAAPDTTATADDNRIAVTWSDWEVVGDDADGTDATDGDVCSIDTATGVVRPGWQRRQRPEIPVPSMPPPPPPRKGIITKLRKMF